MLADRRLAKTFDPNQPRAPRGDPRGGQWIDVTPSDEDPTNVYNAASDFAAQQVIEEAHEGHPVGAPEQVAALQFYQEDGNRQVNNVLRGTAAHVYTAQHPDKVDSMIGALDSLIEDDLAFIAADLTSRIESMTPLGETVRMYRSVNNSEVALFGRPEGKGKFDNVAMLADEIEAGWRAMIGKVVTDRGFTSATTSRQQATDWIRRATVTSTPTLVRLNVAPGVRGAWMNALSGVADDVVVGDEFLLPPGARYRVTGVRRVEQPPSRGMGFDEILTGIRRATGPRFVVTMDVLPPLARR